MAVNIPLMTMRASPLDIDGLNAVLKTALDAVMVMDREGMIRGWNDAAAETFGLSAEDSRGRQLSETIIPHRYREAHERGLTHFLATGVGPVLDTHIEIEALCADGSEIPIELSVTYTEHFGEPLFLGFLRDISERRESERLRQLLIDELNHRVKNLLGVVSGLAHQTMRNSPSMEQFTESFTGRLAALARSHELLTDENWERGSLGALVEALVEPYREGGDRVVVEGPEVLLAPRDFLTIGMILYELLTNAAKYGALADPEGRLRIEWRRQEGAVELVWREYLSRPVAPPERKGFGSTMIAFSARHGLGSEPEWDWSGEGLAFTLRFGSN